MADAVKNDFQEIVGDCATITVQKLPSQDTFTDQNGKSQSRDKFKLSFENEKASCKCNQCWQSLKQAIQGQKQVIIGRYSSSGGGQGATKNGLGLAGFNPGAKVMLPEVVPGTPGEFVYKETPDSIILWHEAIVHGFLDIQHDPNAPNYSWNWDGKFVDPAIAAENIARNCLRLNGKTINDRRPYMYNPQDEKYY